MGAWSMYRQSLRRPLWTGSFMTLRGNNLGCMGGRRQPWVNINCLAGVPDLTHLFLNTGFFKILDTDLDGVVTFDLFKWLQLTMFA